MKNIAIFTVGGSTAPIINAIQELKPDFIYFICSSGSAKTASERLVDGQPLLKNEKIIAKELNLSPSQYEKILLPVEIVDSLDEVYSILEKELLKKIKKKFGQEQLRIIANYTGGTKTMSAALALLSILQDNWELHINTAERSNLIKIDSGDTPVAINKVNLLLKLDFTFWEELMQKFYYEEILEKIKSYLCYGSLLPQLRTKLIHLKTILSAFVLWDIFNHFEALSLLEQAYNSTKNKKLLSYYLFLKQLVIKKPKNEEETAEEDNNLEKISYEMVLDLLKNAERRAYQKRFDDAVARLYRAIEMFAQIRLYTTYNINPGNITPDKIQTLPSNAQKFLYTEYEKNKDEKGKLKIALTKCYELLYALQDPVGISYFKVKNKFLNILKSRNFSILAHGINPISEKDYSNMYEFVKDFISMTLSQIDEKTRLENIPQFPQSFKDIDFNF